MEWKTEASGHGWYLSAGYDADYHKNWNMLMEACAKWDNLYIKDKQVQSIRYTQLCDKLGEVLTLYRIEPVWEQLVKCIKWFNKIKKK